VSVLKLIVGIFHGLKYNFSTYLDKSILEKIKNESSLQYLENKPLHVLKLIVDMIYGLKYSIIFQHILTNIF
jgi:hypothetical protein